jgi:hypothetical protein
VLFLCWLILRWEVSFCVEWPFTSKSFNTKRNLSPQNHLTQRRNLSPQNHSKQKETSSIAICQCALFVLIDFEVRGFVLCWMILRWDVSFCVERFWCERFKRNLSPQNHLTQRRNLSPQNHSKQKETSHIKIFQHKKKPLTSKSFNTKKKPLTSKSFKTKRNLSHQNLSNYLNHWVTRAPWRDGGVGSH